MPFKIDGFLISLVATVALAIVWPAGGETGGVLHMDLIAKYGVSVIFFLYGLTLDPHKMRAGLGHWRLHITVQLATFVLFPLIILAVSPIFSRLLPEPVWLGFFFLAALPSTVSSSVAMTSLAHGNVPVAIFNATLSSLIGVFVTPILMAWYASASGDHMPLGDVLFKIIMLLLVPIIVGQIARRWLARWAHRHNKHIKLADRAIILAIVFNSFADSMAAGIWSKQDSVVILEMIVGVNVLFIVVFFLMQIPCKLLGFNREDTIAAVFCGSKKSLATGVPMGTLMFAGNPALGLIIAPIMLYHFFQLVIVSMIASRYAREAEQAAKAAK